MCVCSGSSWGWMAEDPVSDFDWLIRMMVNVVCRGGNWLVNIGPDRNGKISDEIRRRMFQVGDWLRTLLLQVKTSMCHPKSSPVTQRADLGTNLP